MKNWLDKKELKKYANVGQLILAYCCHEDNMYFKDSGNLTTYGAHCEGLGHVDDGFHVLIYGGEYTETDGLGNPIGTTPNWWFLNDGNYECAANPVKFIPIEETDIPSKKFNIYWKEYLSEVTKDALQHAGVNPDDNFTLRDSFDTMEEAEDALNLHRQNYRKQHDFKLVEEWST